ncbi:MAG TPA: hypothetical protein VGD76_09030 [Ramlibacter sp.]
MNRFLLVFVFLLMSVQLQGCATRRSLSGVEGSAAKTFTVQAPSRTNKSQAEITRDEREEIEKRLKEVLDFCQPRLSGFEKTSADDARKAYWLSMSGLIAGAVIAPALTSASAAGNAPWISALSGWGGATNFAGQALRSSGLSGSTIAETRNAIIANVRDGIKVASDGSRSFGERADALMKARSECILYEIAVPSIPQAE